MFTFAQWTALGAVVVLLVCLGPLLGGLLLCGLLLARDY